MHFYKKLIKNLYLSILILGACFVTTNSIAVDASKIAKVIHQSGSWKIIEFTAKSKIFYRIATDSININETHLSIDFLNQCKPDPVVMIKNFKEYNPLLDKGNLILQYRVPNLIENQEIVDTEMSEGDTYGFFKFKKFSADNLFVAKESSRLAIWVPASGDGQVKRSVNFYFSLEGFKQVFVKAKELCRANN